MKSLYLNALVMMTLTSACVEPDDTTTIDDEVATEAAASIGGCTVLRPVSWNVAGTTCLEDETTPIFVPTGLSYTAISYGWGIYGSGRTTLRCVDDNYLVTTSKSCRPFIGVPP